MDMRKVLAQIEAGWSEEPASESFRRTAARLNVRPEDFDAYTFVHGFHTDPNAPIVNAESFDPIEIWDSLVFSLAHAEVAPEDFMEKVQVAWETLDDDGWRTVSRELSEKHIEDTADLVRARGDVVFLKTESTILAFTRAGEIAGACWLDFDSKGEDTTLFVLPEHRGKGIGVDLVELAAVHIGLSHWFKVPEDAPTHTLAGQRTMEACFRRMAAYEMFSEPSIDRPPF